MPFSVLGGVLLSLQVAMGDVRLPRLLDVRLLREVRVLLEVSIGVMNDSLLLASFPGAGGSGMLFSIPHPEHTATSAAEA